jgi:hypothetical protein
MPSTRVRLMRLALPDSPVDATSRLMDRLRAARAALDWGSWYVSSPRTLNPNPNPSYPGVK